MMIRRRLLAAFFPVVSKPDGEFLVHVDAPMFEHCIASTSAGVVVDFVHQRGDNTTIGVRARNTGSGNGEVVDLAIVIDGARWKKIGSTPSSFNILRFPPVSFALLLPFFRFALTSNSSCNQRKFEGAGNFKYRNI